MGVETPIPQKKINAAAPGRKPLRRIKTVEIVYFLIFKICVNRIGSWVSFQIKYFFPKGVRISLFFRVFQTGHFHFFSC